MTQSDPTSHWPEFGAGARIEQHAAPLGEGQGVRRSAHEPGVKLDAGKIRASLVLGGFSRALAEVSKVGTFGAAKYTDNGWRTVPNGFERYSDAQIRHLLQEASGEQVDPESGLLHAAHTAWNALARLELLLTSALPDSN